MNNNEIANELASLSVRLTTLAYKLKRRSLSEAQRLQISTAWGSDEQVARWNDVDVETVRMLRNVTE